MNSKYFEEFKYDYYNGKTKKNIINKFNIKELTYLNILKNNGLKRENDDI